MLGCTNGAMLQKLRKLVTHWNKVVSNGEIPKMELEICKSH
jgi:hypothetical protein